MCELGLPCCSPRNGSESENKQQKRTGINSFENTRWAFEYFQLITNRRMHSHIGLGGLGFGGLGAFRPACVFGGLAGVL